MEVSAAGIALKVLTSWPPAIKAQFSQNTRNGRTMSERESMPYDVVIVGGGPAGLAAAIRLKQVNADLAVCILEKGSEIGAHILSGAVVDPKALDELLPTWRDDGCPMAETPVTDNLHWVLTKTKKFALPHFIMPLFLSNHGLGQPRSSPARRRSVTPSVKNDGKSTSLGIENREAECVMRNLAKPSSELMLGHHPPRSN